MAFATNLEAPCAALRVCVDKNEGGQLVGTVYSQRLTTPIIFADIGTLILRLDEVLDRQNFPQAFQQTRSFTGRVGDVPAADCPENGLPAEQVAEARGALGTFEVHVISRRSATWQGWVDWMDGSRGRFSSALELIRQIEEKIKA